MEKQGKIYKIENLVNGKVYIGQTIKDAQRRIQVHIIKLNKQYHINRHLQRAWNKYGVDNFSFTIVETCSIESIDDREIYWINYYKEKQGVYNIEGGGNRRKIITEETRKKLSEVSKRNYKDPDFLEKMNKHWKKYSGKNNINSKPVICVNDGKVFCSITAAADNYRISMKAISQSLSGRNPHCYTKNRKQRLKFEYYQEGKKYILNQHISGHCISVYCITTNERFDSITYASDKYSIPTSNISKACKGIRKSAGRLEDGTKLTWKYA